MSKHFTSFKANVGTEVGNRKWFISRGARAARALRSSCSSRSARCCIFVAADGWRSVYPRWNDVVLVGLARRALDQRGDRRRRADAAESSGAAAPRRRGRGRALGGLPALPHRLPAAAGGTAGDARALGAVPRLRDRVRDRRARAAGGAHGDARGARPGVVDLLDLERRRPRHRRHVDGHRRPRLGLRLRARTALVRLGRRRRRLLRRRRRRRRGRRRRAPGSARPSRHAGRAQSAGSAYERRPCIGMPRGRLSAARARTSAIAPPRRR